VGARNIIVRRNVLFNYQGSFGANFIQFGDDGDPDYEAEDCMVENNLLIGNSAIPMRTPFGVKGCRNITFRHDTIVGDTPSAEFAMRLNREGLTKQVNNILFYNNVWSDPTGTMDRFSATSASDILSFALENNAYWNDGLPIPTNIGPNAYNDLINYTDDPYSILGDPRLGLHA